MIELKAILVESGRAFISEADKYLHVAPPYTDDCYEEVHISDIITATFGYGFIEAHQTFEDRNAITEHLLAEYKKYSETCSLT